ncbi:MAG: WecB/TagA/CpsF family glycosyltransferase [Spirochaetia bacterium]|nr:WecB/TagA/CpsF family glycosyltransferase [Spirochaetia bacterium]
MSKDFERQTAKHDDDPILDFQNIPTDRIFEKVKNICNIPFINGSQNELIAYTGKKLNEIYDKKEKIGPLHIQPIDPYIFQRIRHSKLYNSIARESFINLPAAKGMIGISKISGNPISYIIPAPQFVMNLIRYAQAKEFTVFIIGSNITILDKLASNLVRSFPRLRITGKHPAYMDSAENEKVVEALKKTNPHIILVSMGFKKEMKWINNNRQNLKNCVLINLNGTLDIMTGRKKRAPDFIEEAYMTWFWECLNRPWRWHRLLILLYGYIELVFIRLFMKKKYPQEKLGG